MRDIEDPNHPHCQSLNNENNGGGENRHGSSEQLDVTASTNATTQPNNASHPPSLLVEQPQLLSTSSTFASSEAVAVVGGTSSSSTGSRRQRIKERKRWCKKIVCRILTATAVAVYAFLYRTLSSNPSVVLSELYTTSFKDNITEQQQHHHRQESESIYQRELPHIQQIVASSASSTTSNSLVRLYQPVPPSTWCIDERLSLDQLKRRPMGLCYLRIPHAASSTLKDINIRIAQRFGQRQGIKSCIRHDTNDFGMYYPMRDKLSYLWTFVRDPTDRAMSYVGTRLSQTILGATSRDDPTIILGNGTAAAANLELGRHALDLLQHAKNIKDGALSEGRGGYQLQFAMQRYIPAWSAVDPLNPTHVVSPAQVHQHVKRVFDGYDFVGIVERFDESLVAMQLLLGLETSDILYFATNVRSQWQRAKVRKGQFTCRKPFDWEKDLLPQMVTTTTIAERPEPVSSYDIADISNTTNTINAAKTTMATNITSTFSIHDYLAYDPEWYAQNYADYVLYQAANQSLDHTILRIGLDVYAPALKDFRTLLRQAHEQCHPQFPCSEDGVEQLEKSEKDCLAPPFGCAHRCLNNLTGSSDVSPQRRRRR